MLRELLYGLLERGIYLLKGMWIFDELCNYNISENKLLGPIVRGIENVVEVLLWAAYYVFMISITGGLYLVWIGFKLIFRSMRRKHNKKQTRKNKRRA